MRELTRTNNLSHIREKMGEHEKYETTIAELADYIVEKYGMKPFL